MKMSHFLFAAAAVFVSETQQAFVFAPIHTHHHNHSAAMKESLLRTWTANSSPLVVDNLISPEFHSGFTLLNRRNLSSSFIQTTFYKSSVLKRTQIVFRTRSKPWIFRAELPCIRSRALNENQMFVQGFPRCECTVYFDWCGMSLDNANQLCEVERSIFSSPQWIVGHITRLFICLIGGRNAAALWPVAFFSLTTRSRSCAVVRVWWILWRGTLQRAS